MQKNKISAKAITEKSSIEESEIHNVNERKISFEVSDLVSLSTASLLKLTKLLRNLTPKYLKLFNTA